MGSKPRKEIAKDLELLRRDVSSLADQVTGLLSDKGDDIAGDVKQRVQRICDDIEEGISQASAKPFPTPYRLFFRAAWHQWGPRRTDQATA